MRMNHIYLRIVRNYYPSCTKHWLYSSAVYWETTDALTLSKLDAISAIIEKSNEIKSMNITKQIKRYFMLDATGAGITDAEKKRFISTCHNRMYPYDPQFDEYNKYIDMEHGYICLSIPSMQYYKHMSDNTITIYQFHKNIDYSDMFMKANIEEYDKKYKGIYDVPYDKIPKSICDPNKIPFDKWEDFKQQVLENSILKYNDTCYIRVD